MAYFAVDIRSLGRYTIRALMKFELAIVTSSPRAGFSSAFVPSLDPDIAPRLYVAFLCDCVRKAFRCTDRPVIRYEGNVVELRRQVEALIEESAIVDSIDWRERSRNGFAAPIDRPFLIIPGNIPTVPADYLAQAAERLVRDDLVLGPSIDGGVYLLGLRAAAPALFEGITGARTEFLFDGTPSTDADLFGRIRERAAALGMSIGLLPPWYRVDTADNLRRLALELDSLPADSVDDCPFTRSALDAAGLW